MTGFVTTSLIIKNNTNTHIIMKKIKRHLMHSNETDSSSRLGVYFPPRIFMETEVFMEDCPLLAGSNPASTSVVIDGQLTDGYFESDDIATDWE